MGGSVVGLSICLFLYFSFIGVFSCEGWKNYKDVCYSGGFATNSTFDDIHKSTNGSCYDQNMTRWYTPCVYSMHSCVLIYIPSHPINKLYHTCVDDVHPYVQMESEFSLPDRRKPMEERVVSMRMKYNRGIRVGISCNDNLNEIVRGEVSIDGTIYKGEMVCCKNERCDRIPEEVPEHESQVYDSNQIYALSVMFGTIPVFPSMSITMGYYVKYTTRMKQD